jgi:hypothetical protein
MAKRNVSASNVAERPVVSGAKSANVPGAAGAALAERFIADAEAVGKLLEQDRMSRKDKLSKLIALDGDSRKEFLAHMLAKQETINDEAKVVPNRSLRDYMEDSPRAASVYAECSMWVKMAKAVDAGWTPKDDKGAKLEKANWPEWRLIAMQATKALDSIGKPSADGKNPELARSNKRSRGRQQTTPQAKAVTAVRAALKDNEGKPLAKNNRNLADVVRGILQDATLEELQEVAGVVESMLNIATKAKEDAAKVTAKAAKTSKESEGKTTTTSQGATVTHTKAGASGAETREGTIPATQPQARRTRRAHA